MESIACTDPEATKIVGTRFSPDGKVLLSGSQEGLRVCDFFLVVVVVVVCVCVDMDLMTMIFDPICGFSPGRIFSPDPKVWNWEPCRSFDYIDVGWVNLKDMDVSLSFSQLVGCAVSSRSADDVSLMTASSTQSSHGDCILCFSVYCVTAQLCQRLGGEARSLGPLQ